MFTPMRQKDTCSELRKFPHKHLQSKAGVPLTPGAPDREKLEATCGCVRLRGEEISPSALRVAAKRFYKWKEHRSLSDIGLGSRTMA